jgi:hypothetical protein
MKLYRIFLIASLISTFAVLGCGDSGGGGLSAGDACSGPRCTANDALRGTCEAEFNQCLNTGFNQEECLLGAEAVCGGVPF